MIALAAAAGVGLYLLQKRQATLKEAALAAGAAGLAPGNTGVVPTAMMARTGAPGPGEDDTYYIDDTGWGWDPGVLASPGWTPPYGGRRHHGGGHHHRGRR